MHLELTIEMVSLRNSCMMHFKCKMTEVGTVLRKFIRKNWENYENSGKLGKIPAINVKFIHKILQYSQF